MSSDYPRIQYVNAAFQRHHAADTPADLQSIHRKLRPAMQVALLMLQHLDARQRLAFHPFQERAAGGRDIGEIVGDAGMVERRDRVAAAGDRNQLAGLGARRPRALAAATVALSKGSISKAPSGPFQTSVAARSIHCVDRLDRLRADIEDHAVGGHGVDRRPSRWRRRP